MNRSEMAGAIPLEIAEKLCAEIRNEADLHWDTPDATWCFMCREETGGNPARRGILQAPGNRGCHLVNARYTLFLRTHQK